MQLYRAIFSNDVEVKDLYFLATDLKEAVRQCQRHMDTGNENRVKGASYNKDCVCPAYDSFTVINATFPVFDPRLGMIPTAYGDVLYDSEYPENYPDAITYDVRVGGSPTGVAFIKGLTEEGCEWMEKYINADDWQWNGHSVTTGGEYVAFIVEGMTKAGLKVEGAEPFLGT